MWLSSTLSWETGRFVFNFVEIADFVDFAFFAFLTYFVDFAFFEFSRYFVDFGDLGYLVKYILGFVDFVGFVDFKF